MQNTMRLKRRITVKYAHCRKYPVLVLGTAKDTYSTTAVLLRVTQRQPKCTDKTKNSRENYNALLCN